MDKHIDFTKKEIYNPFGAKLVANLEGPTPLTYIHVPFKPFPPSNALKGPIVEYTIFNPNDSPDARDNLDKITKEILDLADQHPKCHGTAYGAAVEDNDHFALLLSWPTVEV